eukprot:scaffold105132_cov38-Prasinocladus_malaysianus.AAC.3
MQRKCVNAMIQTPENESGNNDAWIRCIAKEYETSKGESECNMEMHGLACGQSCKVGIVIRRNAKETRLVAACNMQGCEASPAVVD